MNLHAWLNAIHIIAAIIWTGGMLVMAVVVGWCGHLIHQKATLPVALLEHVRQWSRKVTSPAMVALWLMGLAMLLLHGQMPHAWLIVKILLVIGLSGIHGVLSATLRRLATGQGSRIPGVVSQATAGISVAVALIILLAVFRPF